MLLASRACSCGTHSARSPRCSLLLVPVAPAAAVPDGPLDVYLEHMQPLALEWPADGTLTDRFGPRWGRMHLGLDVGILRSLDVRAAASGTVTASGWLTGYEGYGNVVTVDIGRGYTLLYAHLSVAQVVPGQWLEAAIRSARQAAPAPARARTSISSCARTGPRSTRFPICG